MRAREAVPILAAAHGATSVGAVEPLPITVHVLKRSCCNNAARTRAERSILAIVAPTRLSRHSRQRGVDRAGAAATGAYCPILVLESTW
ncbi:MAG: hypothetical protein LC808_03860 [Actinobacteria bacterium]|nr:hypothetical protein [Actinomycetota bacterium]